MFGKKKPDDSPETADEAKTVVEPVKQKKSKEAKSAEEKPTKEKAGKGKDKKGKKVDEVPNEEKEKEPLSTEKKSKKDKVTKDEKTTAKSKKEKSAKDEKAATKSKKSKKSKGEKTPKKRDSVAWGIAKRVSRSVALHTAGIVFTAGAANIAVAAYDAIDAALYVVCYLVSGISLCRMIYPISKTPTIQPRMSGKRWIRPRRQRKNTRRRKRRPPKMQKYQFA
jgi:hypothetical protein